MVWRLEVLRRIWGRQLLLVLVRIDFAQPFADVYRQMEAAEIAAFATPQPGRDDPSFFFIRGSDAVVAFDRGLRAVTASKP